MAILTLVAVFFGSFFAPLVLFFMKPLGRDIHDTIRTEPAPMTVLVGDKPDSGTGYLEQTLSTSPGRDRSEVKAQSDTSVLLEGREVGRLIEALALDRGATLPVPDSPALQEVDGVVSLGSAPAGLRWFFPFQSERRSYAYYDPITQDTAPLDYVDKVLVRDVEAYHYTQTIQARPASETFREVLPGRPGQRPYHHVSRDILVDFRTGRILDIDETHHLFFAADGEEAGQTPIDQPDLERTIFQQHVRWDQATRDSRYEESARLGTILRALQIIAWIGSTAAVLLVAAMMYTVWAYRRALAARELP